MSLRSGRRLDRGERKDDREKIETNDRSNGNSPKIKLEIQETCGTCDDLRKDIDSLSSKCQIYERHIESLGKINGENGMLVQESKQKIAKLNQVVALLTQQIAEKITENSMLRVESDMNKGGKVNENNCQLVGNNLPEISEDNSRQKETNKESHSEMVNSENGDDVQVIEEAEDEETETTTDKLQKCAWMVSDGKGTSRGCGRLFPAVGDLVSHVSKDHFSEASNVCLWDGCKRNGEPFRTKAILMNHFRTHSGEKPFRCAIEGCDRSFGDLGTLRVHHDMHSRTKYKCLDPECRKVFSSEKYMMVHYKVRHTGERKGFPCPVEGCGKVFEFNHVLRNHWGTHRAERPYQCKFPRCYQSFKTKRSLDEHSETHVPVAGHG